MCALVAGKASQRGTVSQQVTKCESVSSAQGGLLICTFPDTVRIRMLRSWRSVIVVMAWLKHAPLNGELPATTPTTDCSSMIQMTEMDEPDLPC